MNLSRSAIGIKAIHVCAGIFKKYNQITEPTECAVNVLPNALKNILLCKNKLITIGIIHKQAYK